MMDPEWDSAEAISRPLSIEIAGSIFQALGLTLDFKWKGYIIAIFQACNQLQTVLLDYTRIGEVVQFKEHLDVEEPVEEKSPYSSLDEMVS